MSSKTQAGLTELAHRAFANTVVEHHNEEYVHTSELMHELLRDISNIDLSTLSLDDYIDVVLLRAHVETRIFEIDRIKLHRLDPARYVALDETNKLYVRPEAWGADQVSKALTEVERLPACVANGIQNLTSPTAPWVEGARAQVRYGQELLRTLPELLGRCGEQWPAEWTVATDRATSALERYSAWLREEFAVRPAGPPEWEPRHIEFYQFVHERFDKYGLAAMLRIAMREEELLTAQMDAVAEQIHPSGKRETVWEAMKEEAPPWDGVLPMAQRYVSMTADWLGVDGSHVIDIPAQLDYGVGLTPPMSRRMLSFGGAFRGPSVAGRESSYYVITPIDGTCEPDEYRSRLRSYNPYWTHVISYHEWLGHGVQRAMKDLTVTRPVRRAYNGIYFSQAWAFYLEKLLEDEGYFQTLPYLEMLKTRMARLQMRMWRVQRILIKYRMALRQMSYLEALERYVVMIGMERANAELEVERDSSNPLPTSREIIGEREILDMRTRYEGAMGRHYSMKAFHERLLSFGDLPLPVVSLLMLE